MPSLPSPWVVASDSPSLQSGQADVFKVHRRGETEWFALKRLKNPTRIGRFEREIAIVQELRGGGLVCVPEIIDSGTDTKSRSFYVIPWCESGSLQHGVDDQRYRKDLERGLDVLLEVCGALEQVHAAGYAHRDLKPANILLGDGRIVLADFGLALPSDDDVTRLTDPLEAVGSRAYIAPENEDGLNDEVDQRPADFYAFGKVCWAVLTGRPALARENQLEDANRLESALDARFASLDALCALLLERDPRVRLNSWAVVRAELVAALERVTGLEQLDRSPPADLSAIASRLAASRRARQIADHRAALEATQRHTSRLAEIVRESCLPEADRYAEVLAASHGLVQASLSVGGGLMARHVCQNGFASAVPGVDASDWTEDSLAASAPASVSVTGMFRPPPGGATVGVWLLSDGDNAYFLTCAHINVPTGGATPSDALARCYGSLHGPFRLGLSAAEAAAHAAGRNLIDRADDLVRRYLTAIEQNAEITADGQWLGI